MRKSTVIVLLCISAALFGQEFIVDYIDGIVDVLDGNSWLEVLPGDTLTAEDTVRLEAGAILELSGSRSRFTLSEEGRYNLKDLGKNSVNTSGLGSMISYKLKTMVNSEQRGQSAVMGVRAAEAEADEPLTWMSSESDEFIKSGKAELEKANYPEALGDFKTALEFALENEEETEADTARFYVGYVYTLMDSAGPALKYLNDVYPDSSQEYYSELIILKGNLLLSSFAYQTALDWFGKFEENAASAETKQTVKLLKGLAYLGNGDAKKAKTEFKAAKDLDPASDIGKYASEQEMKL